jgi:hypothetical protein
MRTEIHEPAGRLHAGRARLSAKRVMHALEPTAVDAAMDEPLPALELSDDAELLETISQQLDLLREQERSIRRLLNRAGHRRIDGANR